MRKIILLGIFFVLLFFFTTSKVSAACICVDWSQYEACDGPDGYETCHYIGYCAEYECFAVCDSGYYPCNAVGGCCEVGTVPAGDDCLVCSRHLECRKDGAGTRGVQCGWSNTRPIVPKYWYWVSDGCVNVCESTCVPVCEDYVGVKDDGCGGTCACVEGFAENDLDYLSDWSSCDASHTQTRTCVEDCGTDNCTGVDLVRDCVATVSGTLFDASNVTDCSGMATAPKFANEVFGLSGTWPLINSPATSNVIGSYSEQVYAPGTYTYDFSSLISSGRAGGLRFSCQGSNAVVTDYGQTVVRDFGFWRVFGGWWQAKGGSVFAQNGVLSNIPSSVSPSTNQRLILADSLGRTGVLVYGVPWTGSELGTNPDAGVSNDLWRAESEYGGLRYDYNFYKTRMDIFAQKPWVENSISAYDDGGTGYQVFVSENGVSLDTETVVDGGKKVVILVDGNVSINQNIDVEAGSFLSIISSGTITFNTGVTQAEGWFVAETINVPCHDGDSNGSCDQDDSQFLGEGSFVGWTSINLSRNQGDLNNTQPAELFTYRPDFLINVPAPMKVYTRRFSPFIP